MSKPRARQNPKRDTGVGRTVNGTTPLAARSSGRAHQLERVPKPTGGRGGVKKCLDADHYERSEHLRREVALRAAPRSHSRTYAPLCEIAPRGAEPIDASPATHSRELQKVQTTVISVTEAPGVAPGSHPVSICEIGYVSPCFRDKQYVQFILFT